MTIHVVLNPRARGVGDYAGTARRISAALDGLEHRISPWPPAADGRPVRMVVAAGGDGTVNRLLNAPGVRGLPLGILPLGTSNDLARALQLPLDAAAAGAVVRRGRECRLDLVEVNGRRFATCGGVGLPAAAAARADRWRRRWPWRRIGGLRPSRSLYLLAAACEACRGRPTVRAVLETVGDRREGDWLAVAVCNQTGCGGFTLAAGAAADDGLLDVCALAAPTRRGRVLRLVRRAWRKGLDGCREFSSLRTGGITILTREETAFLGDGEILATGRCFRVRVVPAALRVVVPEAPARTGRGQAASGHAGSWCGEEVRCG